MRHSAMLSPPAFSFCHRLNPPAVLSYPSVRTKYQSPNTALAHRRNHAVSSFRSCFFLDVYSNSMLIRS
jgi:hypothetical protein